MSNRSLKVHFLERGKLACCTRGRVLKVTSDVHAVTCNICLYFTGRYTPLVKREELKRRYSTVDLAEAVGVALEGVLSAVVPDYHARRDAELAKLKAAPR